MSSLRLALKQSLEAAGKSSKKKSAVSEYEADFLSDRQKLKRKKLLEAEARKDGRRKKKRRKKDLSGSSFSGEVSVIKNPVGRPRKKPRPEDCSAINGGKDESASSCVVIKKRGPGRPKKIKNRRKDEMDDNRGKNDGNMTSYSMSVPPKKKHEFLRGAIDGRVPGPTSSTQSHNMSAEERSSSDNAGGLSSDFDESSMADVSSQEEEESSSLRDSSDESGDEDDNLDLPVNEQPSSKAADHFQQYQVKNPDVAARLLQSTWKKKNRKEGFAGSSADVSPQSAGLDRPVVEKEGGITGSESEASHKKKKKRLKKLKLIKLKDRMRSNDDDVDVVERGKIGKKVVDLPSPGMKQKKLKRKPRTVPPPVEEVMLAYRKMSDDEKRDYIRIGHRVKVRFDTSDGNVPMRKKERAQYMKWFGGCVSKIYSGALRIRISYDDGTKEIADFPDKEIIIDDDGNGHHDVSDDDGDDEEEEFVGSPLWRGKQLPNKQLEGKAEGKVDGTVLERATKPPSMLSVDSLDPSVTSAIRKSSQLSRISSLANDELTEGASKREEEEKDCSRIALPKLPEVKREGNKIVDHNVGEPEERKIFMKGKDRFCTEPRENVQVGAASSPSLSKDTSNGGSTTKTIIPAISVTLPKKASMIRLLNSESPQDGCKDEAEGPVACGVSQARPPSGSAFRAIPEATLSKPKSLDSMTPREKVADSEVISKVKKVDDLFAPIVKKQSVAVSPRPRSISPIPRKKKRESSPARSKSPVLPSNSTATNDDVQGNVRSGRAAARAANERIKARQEKIIQDTPQKGRRRGKRPKHQQMSDSDDDGSGGEGVWVQCDECQKWRLLPSFVNSATLPDKWFCSMNIYDNYNSCNVPEQILPNSVDTSGPSEKKGVVKEDGPIASPMDHEDEFADKEEVIVDPIRKQPRRRALNSGGEIVEGKKPRSRRHGGLNNKGKKTSHQEEQEWVQCESCQKWRRLPSDGSVKSDSLPDAWFCNMNTWNTKEASCFMDEENYNEKTYTTIMGIGASSNTSSTSSSKLSYRNLIFGTGRKSSRPYSDRSRAEDSLFAVNGEDGSSLLYANYNSYTPGRRYISERKEDTGRLFRVLRKTTLWRELNGIKADGDAKGFVRTSKPLKKRSNKAEEDESSNPFV
uniref:CW-type domain-containing protein n=1 Tax=Leptocylindrus danicus TaxID=163516 RepID=A0A7S2K873_9STRA|mmetsp:Transcript_18775/g.27830  ORF Transcript_18775/g.27830 Transcript_18775/m.27830 type:complete len:1143 (+) Transcript_18775:289-3717(+)